MLMRMRMLRVLAAAALLIACWPEWSRYRAEYALAHARDRIEAVLGGRDRDARGATRLRESMHELDAHARAVPDDARVALLRGLGAMLLGDAARAQRVFEQALAAGERPELVLNLGRARAARGDEAGARRAYLHAAWAAPSAITTLPRAMRDELEREVARREAALRAGHRSAVPDWR